MFGFNGFNITKASDIPIHQKLVQQQAEINAQPFRQTNELKKQTSILEEAKIISEQNAEYTKQIVETAKTNEKTAKIQFKITLAISLTAIFVSLIPLVSSISSSKNTEELYKQQLKKQDEIITLLKQNKVTPITNKN